MLFTKVNVFNIKHVGNTTLLRYDKTWKKLLEIYDKYGCIKDRGKYSIAAGNAVYLAIFGDHQVCQCNTYSIILYSCTIQLWSRCSYNTR